MEQNFDKRFTTPDRAMRPALGVRVRDGRAWIFARRLNGPGGRPVGALGRVLCLTSGGIDSPLAAWMALERGCGVRSASLDARGSIGEPALEKVRVLVRVLATWRGSRQLLVVPFARVQLALEAVTTSARDEGRGTILRRPMMQRTGACLLSAVQAHAGCTLFVARKPIPRGRIASCERIEQRLAVGAWVAQTLEQVRNARRGVSAGTARSRVRAPAALR